jgi:prepilin-type N-terminal cleavage/methylation domain-containing protein/prepilin-type processing-associated H-X9-DG protein
MKKQTGGFTLIELLVVIAIIAVLAAIIFPVFSNVRKRAHQTTCLSNLRQIGMATMMYAQDHDDHLLWGGDPEDLHGGGWSGDDAVKIATMKPQHKILFPYLKNNEIWHCPSDFGFDKSGLFDDSFLSAHPSSFIQYSSSYYTHTYLILLQKPISTMQITFSDGKTGGSADIGFFFDAKGSWHGGSEGDFKNYRSNVSFLDGHAKSLSFAEYSKLWTNRIQ